MGKSLIRSQNKAYLEPVQAANDTSQIGHEMNFKNGINVATA